MRSVAAAYGLVVCILFALSGSVAALFIYRDPFPLMITLALLGALLISATNDRPPRA